MNKENKGDLISREALKEALNEMFDTVEVMLFDDIIATIDNAPTVKFSLMPADETKEDAYKRGYEKGKIKGILMANTRPQGDLAEKLNDRIEDRVCKYCQMNKHCELCEISRVFSIIALTDKEMKEGAENEI